MRVKFFYETDGLTRKNFERNKTDQLTLTKKKIVKRCAFYEIFFVKISTRIYAFFLGVCLIG